MTYHFSERLSYQVSESTTTSKYVLYDNGAFALQFAQPAGEFGGTYEWVEAGHISFHFVYRDRPGTQTASGTINGDLLEVRYADRTAHSIDFEDAVYKLSGTSRRPGRGPVWDRRTP